jgi:hypothetical protein
LDLDRSAEPLDAVGSREPLRLASESSMTDACACFAAFASASNATKYAATLVASGSRVSVAMSTVTAIGERKASSRNAGPETTLGEDRRMDSPVELLKVLCGFGQTSCDDHGIPKATPSTVTGLATVEMTPRRASIQPTRLTSPEASHWRARNVRSQRRGSRPANRRASSGSPPRSLAPRSQLRRPRTPAGRPGTCRRLSAPCRRGADLLDDGPEDFLGPQPLGHQSRNAPQRRLLGDSALQRASRLRVRDCGRDPGPRTRPDVPRRRRDMAPAAAWRRA